MSKSFVDKKSFNAVITSGNFKGVTRIPSNYIYVKLESGIRGKSAYELWLEQGNQGTIEDFFNSFKTVSTDELEETENRVFISQQQKEKLLASLSNYTHDQIASSKEWIVNHNLNKYPSVTIVDTAGNIVIGDVKYISKNTLKISFTSEFSGKAYLN